MILNRWWFQHLRDIFDCPNNWGAPGIWWMRNRGCWISYIDFQMPEWNLERPHKVGTFQDRRYVFLWSLLVLHTMAKTELFWYHPYKNWLICKNIIFPYFINLTSYNLSCHVISILINIISLFYLPYLVFFLLLRTGVFIPLTSFAQGYDTAELQMALFTLYAMQTISLELCDLAALPLPCVFLLSYFSDSQIY